MTPRLSIAARIALAAVACHALTGCDKHLNPTAPGSYTVSVTVSGLTGTGLVLQENGGSNLSVTVNGTFAFTTALDSGTAYIVTVLTQPTGPVEFCGVLDGSGVVATGNVTGVSITCAPGTALLYGSNGVGGVAAFSINDSTGALTAITGSPFAAEASPVSGGWVTTDSIGNFVYYTEPGAGFAGWAVTPAAGILTPLTGAPFAGVNPTGALVISPTGRFAYVANPTNTVGAVVNPNGIAAYAINAGTGALTPVTGSPFATGKAVPASVAITPNGLFAYSANAGVAGTAGNISGYSVNGITGVLTPLLESPFASSDSITVGYSQIAVAPNGQYLYISAGTGTGVAAYAINATTGGLTPVAGSPFVTGTNPTSITIDPGSRFAYVEDAQINGVGTGTISAYTINSTTGALIPVGGTPFIDGIVVSSAINVTGHFLYTSNLAGVPEIEVFAINQTTGAIGLILSYSTNQVGLLNIAVFQ